MRNILRVILPVVKLIPPMSSDWSYTAFKLSLKIILNINSYLGDFGNVREPYFWTKNPDAFGNVLTKHQTWMIVFSLADFSKKDFGTLGSAFMDKKNHNTFRKMVRTLCPEITLAQIFVGFFVQNSRIGVILYNSTSLDISTSYQRTKTDFRTWESS